MKRLPYVRYQASRSEKITSAFGGINQSVITSDGEFADMTNMSCREYPSICTRKPRGTSLHTFTGTSRGMCYTDGLFYVEGNSLYKLGTVAALVSGLASNNKEMVTKGAEIVILPDKICYNEKISDTAKRKYNINESITDYTYPSTLRISKNTSDDTTIIDYIGATGSFSNIFREGDVIYVSGLTPGNASVFGGWYGITEMNEAETQIKLNAPYPFSTSPATSAEMSSFGITRYMPNCDYMCEANNRIWCCCYGTDDNVNAIYASKLGDSTNWKVFEGTAMDSYEATIGEPGQFTGAINFNGYPLFMKDDAIITVYGDKPSNFSITTKKLPGASYHKSMVVINQVLYYVGKNGVYAYNGVSPTKISENIKETITDAVGFEYDSKYYLCCLLGGNRKLLVYDTEKGIWDIEDSSNIEFRCIGDGEAYAVIGNDIRKIEGTDTSTISWMLESTDLREDIIDMKYISKLKFNLWLDAGTEVTIYMKYDDDVSWTRVGAIKSTRNTTYTVPIIPQRCNKFRWKITGVGAGKLIAVGRTVEGGSERDGNIQI